MNPPEGKLGICLQFLCLILGFFAVCKGASTEFLRELTVAPPRSKGARWKGKRWMYTYAPGGGGGNPGPHMNQETAKSFMGLVSASFCDLHSLVSIGHSRFSLLCDGGRGQGRVKDCDPFWVYPPPSDHSVPNPSPHFVVAAVSVYPPRLQGELVEPTSLISEPKTPGQSPHTDRHWHFPSDKSVMVPLT